MAAYVFRVIFTVIEQWAGKWDRGRTAESESEANTLQKAIAVGVSEKFLSNCSSKCAQRSTAAVCNQ